MKYAKKRMLELKMSKCEMYVALLSILEGPAKTLVMKSDHNDGNFNLAMEKLTKEYFNKNLFRYAQRKTVKENLRRFFKKKKN